MKAKWYPSCTRLPEKLECSVPTISRDIEFLRDRFNAPIEYSALKKGYRYTREYDIPLNTLSTESLPYRNRKPVNAAETRCPFHSA
nr:HTH domain-containing protein [Treponema pedis]